jgi:type III secretory pathway component EscR
MSDELELEPDTQVTSVDERFEPGATLFIAWVIVVLVIFLVLILIGYSRPPAGL